MSHGSAAKQAAVLTSASAYLVSFEAAFIFPSLTFHIGTVQGLFHVLSRHIPASRQRMQPAAMYHCIPPRASMSRNLHSSSASAADAIAAPEVAAASAETDEESPSPQEPRSHSPQPPPSDGLDRVRLKAQVQ